MDDQQTFRQRYLVRILITAIAVVLVGVFLYASCVRLELDDASNPATPVPISSTFTQQGTPVTP